jgi:hypothetical protein
LRHGLYHQLGCYAMACTQFPPGGEAIGCPDG